MFRKALLCLQAVGQACYRLQGSLPLLCRYADIRLQSYRASFKRTKSVHKATDCAVDLTVGLTLAARIIILAELGVERVQKVTKRQARGIQVSYTRLHEQSAWHLSRQKAAVQTPVRRYMVPVGSPL